MLVPTDFTGYYRISQDAEVAERLTAYIEKYEKKYLVDLLGYELYTLFLADLTANVPTTPRFQTIFDALNYEGGSSSEVFYPIGMGYSSYPTLDDQPKECYHTPVFSDGILKMLKGFIYFEFLKEYGVSVATTGMTVNKNENSEDAGARALGLVEDRFNDSVDSYNVIQAYIRANPSTYPEFKGVSKSKVYHAGI